MDCEKNLPIEDERCFLSKMKKEFYEIADLHFKHNKNHVKWTAAEIENIISEIEQAELVPVQDSLTNRQRLLRQIYEINRFNGEDLVFLKKKGRRKNHPKGQLVAYEDYFDLILEAHEACAHGGLTKTKAVLNSNFIPGELIKSFLNLCYVCKRHNSSEKQIKFNRTVQVGFLDMADQQDGNFKYVFYYVDTLTNFIVIRAMESHENEVEVSAELLKIFTDFGSPMKIESYYSAVIERSLHLLKKHCPTWDILVLRSNQELLRISNMIKFYIDKWMAENESLNWSIGCRMLQFQMNQTPQISVSPFDSVFGLGSNNVSYDNIALNEKSTDLDTSSTVSDMNEDNEYDAIDSEEEVIAPDIATMSIGEQQLNDPLSVVKENEAKLQEGDPAESVAPTNKPFQSDLPLSKSWPKCHVCNYNVKFKRNTCSKCNKTVHLFCSRRSTESVHSNSVNTTICSTCANY